MQILLTGATGHLGTHITNQAIKQNIENFSIGVRNINKVSDTWKQALEVRELDYFNQESMVTAFKNIDLVIFIPSIIHPSYNRLPEVENLVYAAKIANVNHIMFIGYYADQYNNPFHMSPYFGYAERLLASSGLNYTYVRMAMYMDPLVDYLPELAELGKLIYPVGDGKINYISRHDIAKGIIAILSNQNLLGQRYLLSGHTYSMTELASILSNVAGSKINYDPVSLDTFGKMYDEPKGFGPLLASMYKAASMGLLEQHSSDFEKLTGDQPETFEHFLQQNY
ncbi:SDR family oxidoreductase [Staphylococcus caeli]|uniref:Nucleoside-diphosphate-sugar epimerase n=1 Tax=Staphylococcus caeli TaxID=2201815 RepID=A0A1D4LT85_9STAP|nr:SDR family oxidoreductase [Staphylococcus caeli]SCS63140.1 putative nucleoside-diphosphate-sugar epimerase [Staphylococcus caeli]SCS89476.1 putative nucleoside-diphosphate-sugar epimerase [Staphylococcus caeli]